MKKKLILIAGGIFIVCIAVFIYSCSKKVDDGIAGTTIVPDDLLKAAVSWHTTQTGSSATLDISTGKKAYVLPPTWKEARLQQQSDGTSAIIVPGPDAGIDPKSTRGMVRKFVFTAQNGKITGGRIIEMFSSKDSIANSQNTLIENYANGKINDFTGGAITYNINYKRLYSEVYVKGVKIKNRQAKVSAMTVASFNKKFGSTGKNSLGNPITTLDDCYYLIYWEYDYDTDYYWEEVLDSWCSGGNNNEAGGSGGGGGGGGGGNSTGIFGLNNSNAVVPDANFVDLLQYVTTLGLTVNAPFETVVTINGVQYNGVITQVVDAVGAVVCAYFCPDVDAGPFQHGYEYNIGNGNNPAQQSQSSSYIFVFGTPTADGGNGTATYGAAGASSSSPTTVADNEPQSGIQDNDPDVAWWNDNTTTFPTQPLPSWSNMYTNYPKNSSGGDLPAPQVYALVGGAVGAAYTSNPTLYANACALRVSRALNYSGVNIPQISGQTMKGADNKNYFVSSALLYNFMVKTFGSGSIVLNQSQGGTGGSLFHGLLAGHKGIYIMQADYPSQFGALGHCTLFDGNDCIGGHNYFNATGGVAKITLWILN